VAYAEWTEDEQLRQTTFLRWRIAEDFFEERTESDKASRPMPNQPEIVISSRLNGSGKAALAFGEIVGQSRPLRQIFRQIEMVAPTDATVLVLDETGKVGN
jgi:transcriptional regulator with GAF, ATPase, and Fis domain